jgi:glycosyltransferase involved in cell wall biosynthesis
MADAVLRDELGARARRRIAELSWERILEQHLELYGRVLSCGAPIGATTPGAAPRL